MFFFLLLEVCYVINHFFRDDTGENDVKFSTAFNEENRHTPLEQDELLAFSIQVAKFSGRATGLMIFIDNNNSKMHKNY